MDLRVSNSGRINQASPIRKHTHSSKTSASSIPDLRSNTNLNFSSSQNVSVNYDLSPRACAGTVRFAGSVGFASGYWIGVELDETVGSNDGAVNGVRYFDCRYKHGVFAVPSRVLK